MLFGSSTPTKSIATKTAGHYSFGMLNSAVLILLSSSLALTSCSDLQQPDRILGGNNATIEKYPWMLSLVRLGSHVCGASIVSKRWAMTAAHCVLGANDLREYKLRAGSENPQQGGMVIGVDDVKTPQKVNLWEGDIALLHVKMEFPFGDTVKVVKLGQHELKAGTKATVTGWGSSNNDQYTVLRKTVMVVTDRATCGKDFGFNVTSDVMCARPGKAGTDVCNGDGGGPLTYNGVQYGIVVYGRCSGVSTQNSLYVNVNSFYSWIQASVS